MLEEDEVSDNRLGPGQEGLAVVETLADRGEASKAAIDDFLQVRLAERELSVGSDDV